MKKQLIMGLILCIALIGMGQRATAQVNYMGTVELGINTFPYETTHFGGGLYTTHGVLFNKGIFVGAGLGVDGLMKDFTATKDDRGRQFTYVSGGIPVYGDVMLFPLMMAGNNSKTQFFIEGKVGNMFHIVSYNYDRDTVMYSDHAYQMDKGLFAQAGFGLKANDFKMSFNWTMKTLHEGIWAGSYDLAKQSAVKSHIHGFSFNIGVAF
ncbi:MAG: hypothetical protein Q4D14_05160 [Bacteroidales bacterium]|nr:hypothetical protein [Bacteroidales bacterium]